MPDLKIALVGSAPSSSNLAPYDDPSWQIWACSPGAYAITRRCDVFFEIHRWEPQIPGKPGSGQPWFSVEYVTWLMHQKRVIVVDPEARKVIPNAEPLPWQDLVAKYGPYFFTSSLAWMAAMAMEAGAKTIGFWGVDMAATEEYGYQRAGCQYFCALAQAKGLSVVVPLESDLLLPMPLYGVCELDSAWIKLLARKRELSTRMANLAEQDTQTKNEFMFVKGAVDDLDYMMMTWAGQKQVPPLLGGTEINRVAANAKAEEKPKRKRGRPRRANGEAGDAKFPRAGEVQDVDHDDLARAGLATIPPDVGIR